MALVLTGCVTAPGIDWAGRVGTCTCDQAVLELGPPERSAKLADGTVVAEWVTRRGHAGSVTTGFGYSPYGPGYWMGGPFVLDSSSPEYSLRLTFDPQGKLQAWKRVAR